MTDVLDRLAARHTTARRRKPMCPKCGARETSARVLIQVKRSTPREGKKADETVVSSVRTLCAECVVELYENLVDQLPAPAGPGGAR